MKFTTNNNKIADAMKEALGLITPREPFNLARITAEPGGIRIVCTNTKTEFSVHIPADVETPGVACVEMSTAYNILSKLPKNSEVTFELITGERNELTLSQDRRKYKLPVSNEDPAIFTTTEFPMGETFTDKEGMLAAAITKVKSYIAPDEALEGISCVLLRGENNGLSVVALNGHQFCHIKRQTDLPSILDGDTLLSLKGILEIKSWLLNGKPMEIITDSKRVFFRQELDGITTTFSLLRSLYLYPNYGNFITSVDECESPVNVICDRNEMIDALNRLSVFTTDSARTVQFKHSQESNEIRMTIIGSESGNGLEPLSAEVEGSLPNISFQTSGLAKAMNTLESSKVCLTITGSEKPCRIVGMDELDEGITIIVMPMMVEEEVYTTETEEAA